MLKQSQPFSQAIDINVYLKIFEITAKLLTCRVLPRSDADSDVAIAVTKEFMVKYVSKSCYLFKLKVKFRLRTGHEGTDRQTVAVQL
jgi:hypothetical protein